MPAVIKFSASLKIILDRKDDLIVEAGTTVREILEQHGIKPDLIAMVTCNGELQTKDYLVKEGDEIRLLAVIGGG